VPVAVAAVHSAFMRVLLGSHFFGEFEDNHDETGGKPYAELSARSQSDVLRGFAADGTPLASEGVASAFLLRRRPYELLERVQSQADAAAAAAAAASTRRPFASGYKGADAAAVKCPGEDGDAPLQPVWSGLQLRAWIARGAERGAALWSEFDSAKAAARRVAAP
jgi:hypothetical protein